MKTWLEMETRPALALTIPTGWDKALIERWVAQGKIHFDPPENIDRLFNRIRHARSRKRRPNLKSQISNLES